MLPPEIIAGTARVAGADVRGFYDAIGINLPGWAQREAPVRCFADPGAHRRGDRDPSCSVNLRHGAWHCHGCGAKGGPYDAATALGYTSRAAMDLIVEHGLGGRRTQQTASHRSTTHTGANQAATRQSLPRTLSVSELDVRHWQAALTEQTELIARLRRKRGWHYSTILELKLGYDCGRITIPVTGRDGHLIGLLRYRPWPKPGQPKMIATAGSRRALLPHPAAEPSHELLLVEGEPDMIAARSLGLPAIALPGVDAWRPEWANLFHGRAVTIVMDADPEGRRAAERIAHDLSGHAEATVLDLTPERNDGYDLTDWLNDHPNASTEVLR